MVNPEKAAVASAPVAEELPTPPLPDESSADPTSANTKTSPTPTEARPLVRGVAELFGLVDIATAPTTGIGMGLAGGVLVGPVRAELLVTAEPKHGGPVTTQAGVVATFFKRSAGIRGCYAPFEGTVELSGCLGIDYAFLRGEGFGISNPTTGSTAWWEPNVGAGARIGFGRHAGVRLDGFAGFPWPRHQFSIEPYGVVHTLPQVTGRVLLGIDVRF
jgi:hypothetical protein